MRQTNIICTIGPASWSEEGLKDLVKGGMNFARFNFSHGDHQGHAERVLRMRKVAPQIPLVLDTKGPELRTGIVEDGEIKLVEGKEITITTEDVIGTAQKISLNFKGLPKTVVAGDLILIEDGKMELVVKEVFETHVVCTIQSGGILENTKNVNIPNKDIDLPALTEKDIKDVKFAIENEFDYIAASFIRCKEDVLQIKAILTEANADIKVISKIEHKTAIDNIDEIIEVSDGIMVARGDLGVQVDQERLPFLQKTIIKKCKEQSKFCIVATQMLDSMIDNPRPTRAEVTDVANAILDGADAVMLSGETAKGKFPYKSVKTMSEIAEYTEKHCDEFRQPHARKVEVLN